jgi:hypothetical protein
VSSGWRHRFIIDRWMWELPGGGIVVLDVLAVGRRSEQVTGWDLGWRIDCQARSL